MNTWRLIVLFLGLATLLTVLLVSLVKTDPDPSPIERRPPAAAERLLNESGAPKAVLDLLLPAASKAHEIGCDFGEMKIAWETENGRIRFVFLHPSQIHSGCSITFDGNTRAVLEVEQE